MSHLSTGSRNALLADLSDEDLSSLREAHRDVATVLEAGGIDKTRSPSSPDSSSDLGIATLYSRTWLRSRAPELAVDHLEIEVNALVGSLLPVLLTGVIVLRESSFAPGRLTVTILVAIAATSYFVWRRVNHLREAEPYEAIRNLALSNRLRTADDRA